MGYDAIFVPGDTVYYRRFGFATATASGLRCEFPAADEAFVVKDLRSKALNGPRGLVSYRPEFDAL